MKLAWHELPSCIQVAHPEEVFYKATKSGSSLIVVKTKSRMAHTWRRIGAFWELRMTRECRA